MKNQTSEAGPLARHENDHRTIMPAQTDDPVFLQPQNPAVRVWRYMDFTKFVSLLDSSALYFSRADCLGDPFEGSYSQGNIDKRPVIYKDIEKRDNIFVKMARMAKWAREWTLINCWHMNQHESAAMWKLYAKSDDAIAIVSTYYKLVDRLPQRALIGLVRYIDYDRDWLPEGNSLYPFVHKRRSFDHEREVRAVIQEFPIANDTILVEKTNPECGSMVAVQLRALIDEVYVAPTSSQWLRDLVERVSMRYGHHWPVHRSSLDREPVY
jgi:hypothetical protein